MAQRSPESRKPLRLHFPGSEDAAREQPGARYTSLQSDTVTAEEHAACSIDAAGAQAIVGSDSRYRLRRRLEHKGDESFLSVFGVLCVDTVPAALVVVNQSP